VGEPASDDQRRIAELLRVNTELAAEIRSLSLGRRSVPRLGPLPASRQLAKLTTERDKTVAELQVANAELGDLRGEREALMRRTAELEQEIARLRSGFAGLLRRLRSRLLRS
jgi:chromosome segregation ATPase